MASAIDNLDRLCIHTITTKPLGFEPACEKFAARGVKGISIWRDAVEGLDLVVTSGPILKDPTPSIPAGWLAPGSFACPLDFDSYWSGEAFREVDKLATDDKGQLSYYRDVGYFRETPEPYADLGEIVTGKLPGRENPDERTMSLNLGLAIEDVASAVLVYRRALESGVGALLPL